MAAANRTRSRVTPSNGTGTSGSGASAECPASTGESARLTEPRVAAGGAPATQARRRLRHRLRRVSTIRIAVDGCSWLSGPHGTPLTRDQVPYGPVDRDHERARATGSAIILHR